MRFEKKDEGGEELFKKYNVRGTPTIVILEPDGSEIDRVVSYYPRDERFLKKIEKIYNREDLFTDLKKRYKSDPDDLENSFKLAYRYERSFYERDKAAEIYKQIIAKPAEAQKIRLNHEMTNQHISIYEQALYQLREPKYVDRLLSEIPNTKIREQTISMKASLLAFPRPDMEYKNTSDFFREALAEFPQNESIKRSYLYFGIYQKKDIENVTNFADKWYEEGGKEDRIFMINYANLLNTTGDSLKLKQVYGLSYLDNLPDNKESALVSYIAFWNRHDGNQKGLDKAVQIYEETVDDLEGKQFLADYYLKQDNEKKALEVFGPKYAEKIKNEEIKLYSYAYFWSRKKKNLDSALQAAKMAVEKDKRSYFYNTLGYVYWMMGKYEEAIQCNEQALEIDPDYLSAKNDIKKITKAKKAAVTTDNEIE